MTPRQLHRLGATAMALVLSVTAVHAEDIAEYMDFFEPLPFLPPIPADNTRLN